MWTCPCASLCRSRCPGTPGASPQCTLGSNLCTGVADCTGGGDEDATFCKSFNCSQYSDKHIRCPGDPDCTLGRFCDGFLDCPAGTAGQPQTRTLPCVKISSARPGRSSAKTAFSVCPLICSAMGMRIVKVSRRWLHTQKPCKRVLTSSYTYKDALVVVVFFFFFFPLPFCVWMMWCV